MNDIVSPTKVRYSETIGKLAEALAAAQGEFPVIEKKRTARVKGTTKDGRPYDYTFKYADLGDVLSQALPITSKHGLALTQPTVCEGGVVYIRSRLMHKSGEWMESEYPVIPFQGGMRHQQGGEALTFAKRYAGCAMLGIAPEETVEGDVDMGGDTEVSGGQRPQRQQRPSREPPAVVQSGNGQKPLPPTVGEKNGGARPFAYTDRYGKGDDAPISEDAFVSALTDELKECGESGVKQALDALLKNNAEEMAHLSEPSKQAVERALEEANKRIRAAAVDDDPQKGEPGPMI